MNICQICYDAVVMTCYRKYCFLKSNIRIEVN
uniref:Uncharacterized protein n=1 Tax=Anguilla anguilla TaxID=7936 RepID=A0A0E9UFY9_ANGAN